MVFRLNGRRSYSPSLAWATSFNNKKIIKFPFLGSFPLNVDNNLHGGDTLAEVLVYLTVCAGVINQLQSSRCEPSIEW